ncbi:MAG: urea ABC transporter permease subunit UrtB [Pseudomonadota bacterium]
MPSIFAGILLLALVVFAPSTARADVPTGDVAALVASDRAEVERAIESLSASHDPRALAILSALLEGSLRVDSRGNAFAAREGGALEPLNPAAPRPDGPVRAAEVDNRLRRLLEPAIAAMRLRSDDRDVRLSAATELARAGAGDLAKVIERALAQEADDDVREKLALALAPVDLESTDTARRLRALAAIKAAADPAFRTSVQRLLEKDERGEYRERNAEVRRAASSALSAIELHALWFGLLGHLFYGVSLGSVLLLAALGLAITFGLMRVINMAHGELLLVGAYSTFVVQQLFQKHLPAYADYYLLFAIPVGFLAAMAMGMLLERTVLRFLYGRPLETLLATWGISLILIQTVRLVFGAQNVTVANPSFLSGGIELTPEFVLTYSRIAVIAFSAVVVAFVWFMLQRTPLGLNVRAVTQNREMAAGMGISTRRVDLWTFGIGSGVAGLGGVALSQLGNVGPELGQGYIVDSFMVVVLGGVGKLAGTLAGALGLGIVNKLLEPVAGAVLGKIAILVFLILFIQRRPQGIFALKGRAAEVS